MSTIGVLQFIAPTVQLFIGIAMGEAFTIGHAVTFGLIWTGVLIFTLAGRQPRIAAPTAD
jgi:chloramphenicol-sensitive protein RarD